MRQTRLAGRGGGRKFRGAQARQPFLTARAVLNFLSPPSLLLGANLQAVTAGILGLPKLFSVITGSKSLSESTDLLLGSRRVHPDAVIFLPVDSARSPPHRL